MKKNVLFLSIALSFIGIVSVNAQEVRFAFQGGYGAEIEKGAAGFGFEIFLVDRVSVAPGVNFYIPPDKFGTGNNALKISYWEYNIDMHVYALRSEGFGLYGIVGLNVLNAKAKVGNEKDSDSETGANLGLGISVGPGLPFIEAKYETVSTGQFFIGGGFRFPIN